MRTRSRGPRFALARAAVAAPREVATLFPTSGVLARGMLEEIDWERSRSVVELGPGDGAITRVLAERLPEPTRYLGLEIDRGLTEVLRQRFPDLRVECRPAHDLGELVEPGSVDHVVASLPWALLSAERLAATLLHVRLALRPGGSLRTYLCVHAALLPGGRAFLDVLHAAFTRVERGLELRNLPPVWTFIATG